MFLPENNRRMTNLNVISLKMNNKKYEIGVYPNTLYEFRHNPNVDLGRIIPSDKIYKNISIGDVASESDLAEFKMTKDQILKYILSNGHEQKSQITTNHELEQIEKQIVDLVQNKVKYNGIYLPKEMLLKFIKSVSNVKNIPAKKQVSHIIKKLEEIGFERVNFKIKCDLTKINFENATISENFLIVKSDVLPDFISYAEANDIKYVIIKNEEVEEEEIC